MNVSIKTSFAEMSFEMSPDRAKNLIRVAVQLASSEEELPHPVGMKYADPPEEPRPEAESQKSARSRVETMFGARETWNTPAATEGKEEERESYKGFLFIRCEACGKEKGYSSKYPLTFHKCDCGHRTDLHDLKPVHLYTDARGKLRSSAGFLILTEIFLLSPERRIWLIVHFMNRLRSRREMRAYENPG